MTRSRLSHIRRGADVSTGRRRPRRGGFGRKAWIVGSATLVVVAAASVVIGPNALDADGAPPLLRVDLRLASPDGTSAHPLVIILGGPVYCDQAVAVARFLRASILCPDYGRDGERSGASRSRRMEDWGNPAYLDAVARVARRLARQRRRVSEVILIGASYAGFAAAELAATHPELRPRALIVVDSFFDLRERFRALETDQATRLEMIRVLGGTPEQRLHAYRQRSPSTHLAGLASEIRRGMRFVDVWSIGTNAAREFNGAMCSKLANSFWLRKLAGLLHRPVTGYVTRLQHATALWDWWRQLLALAGLATAKHPLPATAFRFRAGEPIQPGSYCKSD
jgi:pimeloyl-ACP methyl ester carboxylesterase